VDDLGVPLFLETSIYHPYIHIFWVGVDNAPPRIPGNQMKIYVLRDPRA